MIEYFERMLHGIVGGMSSIALAILILLGGFLVAWIAKKIVMGVLDKTGAEKFLAKTGIEDEETGKATGFVGKLVFLLVFFLFLPEALDKLGMENVSITISGIVASILGYLPKLLAAGIILYIGLYIAKIVRQLLKSLLNRVGVDKLQAKLLPKSEESSQSIAGILSGLAYVLILIPIIIEVLNILGLQTVSEPATMILNQIFAYIPNILVAAILIGVGYFIAKIVTPLLEGVLSSLGLDALAENLFPKKVGTKQRVSLAKVFSEIVRWVILIVFFMEAIIALKLSMLTNISASLLAYLPLIISAFIIMGLGVLLGNWIENLIKKHAPKQTSIALISKLTIFVVFAFMTLSQLGFAQTMVNQTFGLIIAGLAVAFALAFGLGGREFAASRLSKLENKLDDLAEETKEEPVEVKFEEK